MNAYQYSIKLLTQKDYSQAKLRRKLLEKDFEEQDIDETINCLIEKRFLREDFYIEARVRGLMKKFYSPYFIQQRLEQENCFVQIDTIDEIFAEQKVSTIDQITEFIQKKIKITSTCDKQKLIAQLMNKGHEIDEIKQVLNNFLVSINSL